VTADHGSASAASRDLAPTDNTEQQEQEEHAEQAEPGEPAASRASLEGVVARLAGGYRSIGDMVYDVLREAILSGAFSPGEWLRQEALATAIGVSRLPVRAALVRLDAEGLVEFHPRRGAVVQTLSHSEITEIYELRTLLETYALRKSMATMTPQRVTRLRELATQLDAEAEGDPFLDKRVLFYRELYDAGNAPHLTELIEGLRSSVGRYLLGWRVSHGPGHGTHSRLVDLVANGDADGAERWLREHLKDVSAGVDHLLYGDTPPDSSGTSPETSSGTQESR
jgi:DNA-binding GntR family transcriptional regulator